jgi:hypothetical protein
MLPIIAISPAGLDVIFLSGAAMNIVLPADTVQSGDAVMQDMGGSMAIQRDACAISAPLFITRLRTLL